VTWSTISASEAVRRLTTGARGLDVRSEGEFAQGALPEFSNVPVLRNDHRHLVGLAYKQRGPSVARALGYELVEPLREDLVKRWRSVVEDAPASERLLVCWRGGLRSSSVAEALAQAGVGGVRVEGGYKAMRHVLVAAAEDPPPLVVLSGLTGSGKTDLLREIPNALDLEGFANHRGSAFGLDVDAVQPAQQTFENRIGFAIRSQPGPRVVEDESAMIGRNVVPQGFRARMTASPLVVMNVPLEERARQSFEEYIVTPSRVFGRARAHEHVATGVRAVGSRLGGLRTREILDALTEAFAAPDLDFERFAPTIIRMLTEYYDPMYEFGRTRRPRVVEFSGTRAEVKDYLLARAVTPSQ
jgi:tRNA 2-selenouridine synthase